jgi:hypothetical protein
MTPQPKTQVAGHRGMVGSAIFGPDFAENTSAVVPA